MVGAVGLLVTAMSPAALGWQWTDPLGDTLGTASPTFDLLDVTVGFAPGNLVVMLTLASATDLDALSAFIDFDTDLNQATGRPTHLEDLGLMPAPAIGVDYYIYLYPYTGIAEVFQVSDGMENSLGVYPSSIDGYTVSITVPKCAAPCPGGSFDMAVVIGNADGPTDRAPNDAVPLSARPLPGDFDADGDVDGDDLAHMQSCQTGPGVAAAQNCLDADLDHDGDVDQDDFGLLQLNYTGSY